MFLTSSSVDIACFRPSPSGRSGNVPLARKRASRYFTVMSTLAETFTHSGVCVPLSPPVDASVILYVSTIAAGFVILTNCTAGIRWTN